MVEEHFIAGLHRLEIVSRLIVSYACPVSAAVTDKIVPGVSFRLLLHHPVAVFVFSGSFHEIDLDPLQFEYRPSITTKDKPCPKRDRLRLHSKPKTPTANLLTKKISAVRRWCSIFIPRTTRRGAPKKP